jgi:hypothetical protein
LGRPFPAPVVSRSLARRRTWRGPGKLTLLGRCRRGFDPSASSRPRPTPRPSAGALSYAGLWPFPLRMGVREISMYYKWHYRLHATSSAILARPPGRGPLWPADKLTALRTGQRLITEVPASRPGRRAFIDITPVTTPPTPKPASRAGNGPTTPARSACSTGITTPTVSTATTTTAEPS